MMASVLIFRTSGVVTAEETIGRCAGLPLRASGGMTAAATTIHACPGASTPMRTSARAIANTSAPRTAPRHDRVLRETPCSERHSGELPSTTAFDRSVVDSLSHHHASCALAILAAPTHAHTTPITRYIGTCLLYTSDAADD